MIIEYLNFYKINQQSLFNNLQYLLKYSSKKRKIFHHYSYFLNIPILNALLSVICKHYNQFDFRFQAILELI